MSEYENGERNPALLTIYRLANAIGVTPAELVDDL
ncbi:helix-turn-helix domain-containing protein [Stieleria varia]